MSTSKLIRVIAYCLIGIFLCWLVWLFSGCAWNRLYWNRVDLQPSHEVRMVKEYHETQW